MKLFKNIIGDLASLYHKYKAKKKDYKGYLYYWGRNSMCGKMIHQQQCLYKYNKYTMIQKLKMYFGWSLLGLMAILCISTIRFDDVKAEAGEYCPKPTTIDRIGGNEFVQAKVDYAYKLGGMDFVLTLDCENGLWTNFRKSNVVGANGYSDWGLCQLNGKYHKQFIFKNKMNLNEGFSDDFKDHNKQIEYCYGVWQDAFERARIKTTFYAYNVRHRCLKNFIIN